MFKFLNALTYDGNRGTVLRLEDLGDRFRVSLVIINPSQYPGARPVVGREVVAAEEAESELQLLSES